MRTRLTFAVLLTAVAALAAQTPQDRPTFRSGANYVRVDMAPRATESRSTT